MGFSRDDMASVYREKISDERQLAVVEHVRKWLPKPKTKTMTTSKAKLRLVG